MCVPPGPRDDGTPRLLRSSLHGRTDLSCRSSPVPLPWLLSPWQVPNLPPSCGHLPRSSSSRGGGARRHGPGTWVLGVMEACYGIQWAVIGTYSLAAFPHGRILVGVLWPAYAGGVAGIAHLNRKRAGRYGW